MAERARERLRRGSDKHDDNVVQIFAGRLQSEARPHAGASNLDVIQILEELLASAKRNEITGLMHFAAGPDDTSIFGQGGSFYARQSFAAVTLLKGLNKVIEHIAGSSPAPYPDC